MSRDPETPESPSTPDAARGGDGARAGAGGGSGRRRLGIAAVAVAVIAAGAVPVAWGALHGSGKKPKPRPESLHGPAGTAPAADFDHDGAQDVYATGELGGAVSVVYGARKGGSGAGHKERRQRLDLDSPGVPGRERRGVSFGDVTEARDIDADGYTDLLTSVKMYGDADKHTHAGVIALWGSPKGLRGGTYLKGVPRNYQGMGVADDPLVAGDFTGDGYTDLVVRLGGRHGLLKGPFGRDGASAGSAAVPAASPDPGHSHELLDAFAGDLNGDGADDLVTSQATEDDGMGGGKVESGYAAGGRSGFRKPDTTKLPGIDTATTGDVDNDGYTDVVLRRFPKGSAPDSAVSGPVEVVYGSRRGPDPGRRSELDQDSPGVPGEKHSDNRFGDALEAGDADGDGYADVAVGTVEKGGGVAVLHGGRKGLTGRGAELVDDPSSESGGKRGEDGSVQGSRFGAAIRFADTDGDGSADLAAGAPSAHDSAGALWIFPARKGSWPGDAARSYGPRDFGDPKAPDDERFGTHVR